MENKRTPGIPVDEILNSVSHGIAALAAVGGMVVLIAFGALSDHHWTLLSALVYGSSLVLLYAASTAYHAVQKKRVKDRLRVMDHACIYLLIAGTYTPILLVVIGGPTGWVFFTVQWSIALVGITLKIFFTGKYDVISLLMYLLMGWLVIFKINALYLLMPTSAFWLLIAGGLAYSIGTIFYALDKKMPFGHFIWHLFVVAGSLLHFLMIILYVI